MFGSDNQAPAHPAVLGAVMAANTGRTGSYGDDAWTRRAEELVREAFETRDLDLYLVATGGAANGLALSVLCPPWGSVVCAPDAHVLVDEGTGPALFTGGAALMPAGRAGEILTVADLDAVAVAHDPAFVHGLQPRALTLTNLTETGRAIGPERLAGLCAAARRHGWGVHVDGARFANALAATGARPAALSWEAGVDVLSLGLTKGGAMMAEAVVVFGQARSTALPYLRKRAGQLVSKHRFLSAQLVAMLDGGLWLELARRANERAAELAAVLVQHGAELLYGHSGDGRGNELFARVPPALQARLVQAGAGFFPWSAGGVDVVRFVTSWDTPADAIRALGHALAGATV